MMIVSLFHSWETWFSFNLGVPIPALIGPPQQCTCNTFHYDSYGDHLQTCQTQSAASQVHDWVVYKLGALLGSVGHEQSNRLPPPRTLIVDFTITHIRFDQICTLLDNLHRQGVQMVLLIQMGDSADL
jgi:hypothetical protein